MHSFRLVARARRWQVLWIIPKPLRFAMCSAPANLLPTPRWARDGRITAVPVPDVLHDLRCGRDVYLGLPGGVDVAEVRCDTIIPLYAVSEDEEFFVSRRESSRLDFSFVAGDLACPRPMVRHYSDGI